MNDSVLNKFVSSLGLTPKSFFALEPLLRHILDLIPIRVYLKDLDHRFVLANRECIRAAGCSRLEDVIGKTDDDFFTPPHAQQARKDELAILKDPSQSSIVGKEEPETWKDGRKTWVKSWKWPWFDETKERAIGIVGLSAEITHSRELFDRYRAAAAHAHSGLWHRNLQTGETWFSPRWKALLGYEDHEFPNDHQNLMDCIHPDDLAKMQQAVDDHIGGKTPTYCCEFRMRHKDGSWKWIQSQGARSNDKLDRPVFAGSHADITDVKEKLLFYKHLIDSVPTFIFLKDDQFRFQFVNKALANAFGKSTDEFKNKTDKDINPKSDQIAKFRRDDEIVLHEKEELDIEEEDLFLENADRHLVLATKKRRILLNLDDPSKAGPNILGVSVDITPLMHARDEIQKGNQQLEFLMNNAPDGIFIKNRECQFVRVTETLAALAGRKASELIGKTDLELFGDDQYYAESLREDQEIIRTKTGKSDILRLTPTKQGPRYRLISKVPVLDHQGNVIYIMGISKDVHDFVTVNTMLDSVLNNIPQFVFVKNYNGRYELVNERFAKRHKETPQSIIGKTDFDFWDSEQAQRYQRDDREVLETGRERRFLEEQLFQDGSRRILETSKIPLRNAAGKPYLVLGIYEDVTERLDQREREMQVAVHGKVIGSLSHCLKHWMAPIEGSMLHLAIETPKLKESECYQRLKSQITIVKESIQLATQYASLQPTRPLRKQSVDLNELISEITNAIANFQEDVPVDTELPRKPVRVLGERAHLRNAIAQLVTNAKQALSRLTDGRIRLRLETSGIHCRIHVIDNGPGICERLRPVLFEVSVTKADLAPNSTGIGLHYVHCVAEAHGGSIREVSSETGMRGSHFILELPCTNEPLT